MSEEKSVADLVTQVLESNADLSESFIKSFGHVTDFLKYQYKFNENILTLVCALHGLDTEDYRGMLRGES